MTRINLARGRLSTYAQYDDVVYLEDGQRRVESWRQGGVGGFVRRYADEPPHSPYASLLAAAGRAMFGPGDAAPYVLSGWCVLAMLAAAYRMSATAEGVRRGAATLFVLTVPITANVLLEFRPDIAAGCLSAIAVALLLVRRDDAAPGADPMPGPWRMAGVGALFAAALLAKTSTFPVTLVLMAAGLIAATVVHARRGNVRRWLGRCAMCVLPAAILAAPHYAIAGPQIVGYIRATMTSGLWHTPLSGWQHATYYLRGNGGTFMSRSAFWPIAVVLVAAVAWAVRRGGARREVLAWAIVLAPAYLIPTISGVKQEFLAAPFHALLVLAAVRAVACAARQPWPRPFRALAWAAPAVLLIGAVTMRVNSFGSESTRRLITDRNDQLLATLEQRGAGVAGDRLVLLITGLYNENTIRYAWRERHPDRPLPVSMNPNVTTAAEVEAVADWGTFVLTADPPAGEVAAQFAGYGFLARSVAVMDARPDYRQVLVVPTQAGGRIILYERRGRVVAP